MKVQNIKTYQPFEQVFLEILSEYSTLKKNFLRASHVRYETKLLRKAIMPFTELESKYLKNRTIENKTKCKEPNNFYKRPYEKERKFFFSN